MDMDDTARAILQSLQSLLAGPIWDEDQGPVASWEVWTRPVI